MLEKRDEVFIIIAVTTI